MTYSDRQMREISRDPVRLRSYFWRVATNARLMATIRRDLAQRGFKPEPCCWGPDALETFAASVVDNIDTLVESTLQRSP